MILSEHLVRSDTDGRDFRVHWWKWTFGRLQQIFMQVGPQSVYCSATDCCSGVS